MFAILDYVKLGVGAIIGIALSAAPVYYYGKHEGKQAAAVQALTASVDTLRKKGQIHGEISSFDAATLCRSFGLSADDTRECMRRVVEADTKP